MAWESGNEAREFCMRIGDYVAGAREGFNSVVRNAGNRLYGGLGNVLTSDISPRRVLSVGLVGLAIGGGVSNSGCSDYGNALSRSVGEYALMEGVAGAVRNEVEGPRGTVVEVGGGGENNNKRVDVPVDVSDFACLKITSFKTGEIEYISDPLIFKGSHGYWNENNLEKKYLEKFPDGFRVDVIREGRISGGMLYKPNERPLWW